MVRGLRVLLRPTAWRKKRLATFFATEAEAMSKVWFITDAGSGIGAGTAKAALTLLLSAGSMRAIWARIRFSTENGVSERPSVDRHGDAAAFARRQQQRVDQAVDA